MSALPLSNVAPGWSFANYDTPGNVTVQRRGNAMRVEFDLDLADGLRANTTNVTELRYSYFVEHGNVIVPGNLVALENELVTCSVIPGAAVVNGVEQIGDYDPNAFECYPLDTSATANATLWGFYTVRSGVPLLRHYYDV